MRIWLAPICAVILYCSMVQHILHNQTMKYFLESSNGTDKAKSSISEPPVLLNSMNTTIAYMHIGKSGGTTLDTIFHSNCLFYQVKRRRDQCLSDFMKTKESILSKKILLTVHGHPAFRSSGWSAFDKMMMRNQISAFLLSVRNPVSRAVSAFNYQHVRNQRDNVNAGNRSLFYECFPTVEDLAIILMAKKKIDSGNSTSTGITGGVGTHTFVKENVNNSTTFDCLQLGKDFLVGNDNDLQTNGHMAINYGLYANKTIKKFPEKDIFVVRTEKLWYDIKRLNIALGGREDVFTNVMDSRITHGSDQYEVKDKLSKEGRATFCCFLYSENQIYEEILSKSQNLNDDGVKQSLSVLYSDCGIGHDSINHSNFSWFEWASEKGCMWNN